MILYHYRGLDKEKVPKVVTHVIVDDSVTTIKVKALYKCRHLVSIVMGDNVQTIEKQAFNGCRSLKCVRLSKVLRHIGLYAFYNCKSLEILIIPSTIERIGSYAFWNCSSLRLLALPDGIDPVHISKEIINRTAIYDIAVDAAGVHYEEDYDGDATGESNHRVNNWLIHYMDDSPLHRICCSVDVSMRQINDYLKENGNASIRQFDAIHEMTPMHMLAMNPHAAGNIVVGSMLNCTLDLAFLRDREGKSPLDYTMHYNLSGLVVMIEALCLHQQQSTTTMNAAVKDARCIDQERGTSRKRIRSIAP